MTTLYLALLLLQMALIFSRDTILQTHDSDLHKQAQKLDKSSELFELQNALGRKRINYFQDLSSTWKPAPRSVYDNTYTEVSPYDKRPAAFNWGKKRTNFFEDS